ncbi:MAG: HAMP domain-containing protein, partial [Polyangiaceae bacterium]|nr:HAMP domain-containing protein [Polyangiaceae bacterium]
MKLGTKIAIVMSALTTTVLSTLGVLDVERDRSFFEADTTHDQLTIANVLASGAERQLQAGRDQDVTALLSSETRREGQLEVVWGWLDPPALGAVPRMSTELTARLARAGWLSFRTEGANAKQWTMVPGAAADGRHFFVAVGESLQPERAHLIANAVRTGGSILLLALLCSGAIVAIGRRFVGKPVESLVEHARRVAAGDLTRRLHVGQNDEIGVLAREMNTMTEALA